MTNPKPKITIRLKRVQEFLNRQKYKYDVLEQERKALPKTADSIGMDIRMKSKMEQIAEIVGEAARIFELEDPFNTNEKEEAGK